jgi:TonB family protein
MSTNPIVLPTARAPKRPPRFRLTVGRLLVFALVSFVAGMAYAYVRPARDAALTSVEAAKPPEPAAEAPAVDGEAPPEAESGETTAGVESIGTVLTGGAPAPSVVRVSEGVLAAKAVRRVEPVYPAGAGVSGQVVVEVTIDERGQVISARAISGPSALRAAATTAARAWEFEPATRMGVPLTTIGTITFALENPEPAVRTDPAPARVEKTRRVSEVRHGRHHRERRVERDTARRRDRYEDDEDREKAREKRKDRGSKRRRESCSA